MILMILLLLLMMMMMMIIIIIIMMKIMIIKTIARVLSGLFFLSLCLRQLQTAEVLVQGSVTGGNVYRDATTV